MALFSTSDSDPDGVGVFAAEFDNLRTIDAQRLDRYRQYRLEGQEVRETARETFGGGGRDYFGRARPQSDAEPSRHRIPLPLGKALNVKHSYRIAGRLPDVIVDKRDSSPEERYRSETMEKIVWAILRASRGETQFASAAWDSSELGAACFDLYFNIAKQMPLVRAVDPAGIVEVQGVDDPHEFQRVYRFWDVPVQSLLASYSGKTLDGRPIAEGGQPLKLGAITASGDRAGVPIATVCSMCDPHQRITFIPHCGVALSRYVHDYGFTPYVVIPNIGPERDVWGWADYEFVRPLVHYLSAVFSREADIIRAVSNGTYLEKGTGQTPKSVKSTLATGGVIPSKRDGSVDPIMAPEAPAFEDAHTARGMELFKMLGFAPDAAWGNGFSGSGSDRGLQLQPLVEFTAMKQKNWESGLGRLFSMAYRMIEQKMVGETTYRGSVQDSRLPSRSSRKPFALTLGPDLAPDTAEAPVAPDDPSAGFDDQASIEYPRSPKELFDGDYEVRFTWNNRIDPDDPAYALSEVNRFTAGVQSLETTMERLGVESPEDEMKRMEAEADRFPWINQGLIALLRAKISAGAQGDGGGQPNDPLGDSADAVDISSGGPGGALPLDGATRGLGQAAHSGIPYGGA